MERFGIFNGKLTKWTYENGEVAQIEPTEGEKEAFRLGMEEGKLEAINKIRDRLWALLEPKPAIKVDSSEWR